MSASKKSKNAKQPLTAEAPLLSWIGALGVALFLVIFPFDRALFNGYEFSFDEPIYNAIIYSIFLLILIGIYVLKKWELNSYHGVMSIAIAMLPVVYLLASFQAVSSYYAKFMVLIAFLLATFFLAGLYFGEHVRTRKIIEYGLMGSAYLIVIFGLLNLFGQVYYDQGLWLAHDGYRLSSVFQYSNTYGAFLAAIFLMSVYYAVHCTKRYAQLFHAFMLVPVWISFMLTYSRGALVLVPVLIVLIMPFLKMSRQIAYIATAGVSILISTLLLGKLTANADAIANIVQPTEEKAESTISLFSSLPLQSWALLLLGSVVMTAIMWLYHAKAAASFEQRINKLASFKWSFAAIPAAIILLTSIVGGLLIGSSAVRSLLPEQLADRIANINFQQHSVLERFTFYKDGLKFVQDYPVFGAGGGSWPALYEVYQNNPYQSRQAHSYFIQSLVETGWLGLIFLVALLAAIYLLYIRSYIRQPERRGSHLVFFIFASSMLIHSIIDFDMSYVYIGAMVFLSLGAMLAPYGKQAVFKRSTTTETTSAKASHTIKQQKSRYIFPAATALIAITLLVVTVREQSAINKFNEAYNLARNPQSSLEQVLKVLDKAIKTSPTHTDFRLVKADWLEQGFDQSSDHQYLKQALDELNLAQKYDPYNRLALLYTQRVLQKDGQADAHLQALNEGLVKFPWTIDFYESAMTAHFEAYTAAIESGDTAEAEKRSNSIQEIYNELLRRLEQLKTLPPEQQQGNPFSVTENIQKVIDQLNI